MLKDMSPCFSSCPLHTRLNPTIRVILLESKSGQGTALLKTLPRLCLTQGKSLQVPTCSAPHYPSALRTSHSPLHPSYSSHTPSSSPLPGLILPQGLCTYTDTHMPLPSFRSLLRCHLLGKAFPAIIYELYQHPNLPSMLYFFLNNMRHNY